MAARSFMSGPSNPSSFVQPHRLDTSLALSDWTEASQRMYADPSQALLFLDWDDTLFPTTYIRRRYPYPWSGASHHLQNLLAPCAAAIEQFLKTACKLSTRCVILTLAQPGWIEHECLPLLGTSLRRLFDTMLMADNLRIVYADRGQVSCVRALLCADWFNSLLGHEGHHVDCARARKLMEGKNQAMADEASDFYSRYPDQSWKNVLSIGDSLYEYIAMQRLGSWRRAKGGKERHLRSKVVRFQTDPTVTGLTLQLRLFEELLPQLVRHNGCLNMNLAEVRDPLKKIGHDLGLPHMADLHPLRIIWDRAWDAYTEEPFVQSLAKVRRMVESLAPPAASFVSSGMASSPSLTMVLSNPSDTECFPCTAENEEQDNC